MYVLRILGILSLGCEVPLIPSWNAEGWFYFISWAQVVAQEESVIGYSVGVLF